MKPIMVLMDSDFPQESLREESALDLRNIKDAAWGDNPIDLQGG